MAVVAGLGAVLGHCFPVWLKFQGGKGVATALGVMAVLTPLVALLAVLLFVVVTALSRYVSLGSMLGAVAACALAWYFGHVAGGRALHRPHAADRRQARRQHPPPLCRHREQARRARLKRPTCR